MVVKKKKIFFKNICIFFLVVKQMYIYFSNTHVINFGKMKFVFIFNFFFLSLLEFLNSFFVNMHIFVYKIL